MRWLTLTLVIGYSSYSIASEFREGCKFHGTVLEINDFGNLGKYATILVETSSQLYESDFNTCESLVGIEHEFPYDDKRRPLEEGEKTEILWIYWNDENDESGEGWLWRK